MAKRAKKTAAEDVAGNPQPEVSQNPSAKAAKRAAAEPAASSLGAGTSVVYRAKAAHEHPTSTLVEMPATIVAVDEDGNATLDIDNGGARYRRSGVPRDVTGQAPRSWRPAS
jgi:hypothetical protein